MIFVRVHEQPNNFYVRVAGQDVFCRFHSAHIAEIDIHNDNIRLQPFMEETIKKWLFDPTIGKFLAAAVSLAMLYWLVRFAQRSVSRYINPDYS
jgi:hypothetical protein